VSALILNEEQFESLRFFEPDSRMHKIISEKLREIVGRLFQGTDINLDDFYFTVVDKNEPNAFFIQKSDTVGKKNIIAVTRGLIEKASREEILAAVIAHETGHYIWSEFIGGKNTIIQERFADIDSVDLMIRGGWNPQYVTVMQQEIFGRIVNNNVTFDVHGSSNQRVISTEDKLAYIANQRGYFADITHDAPDTKWQQFQNEVKKIYAADGYDTFLDKQLKQKFGTKDLKALKRIDVLKLFLSLVLDEYPVSLGVRFTDLQNKLHEFDFTSKSEEETKILQNMFLHIAINRQNFPFFTGSNSKIYQESFESTLRHFHLKGFGPFLEQYENIENLIKYYDDEEKAVIYAKKISDLRWTLNYWKYLDDLTYPSFKPFGEKNIGKMLPWHKLKSYNRPEINEIYNLVCLPANSWYSYGYSRISDYNERDYYLDKNGIVIAFGEKARQLNERDRNKALYEQFEKQKQANLDRIQNKINLFENFARYIDGEINVLDFLKSIKVNFTTQSTEFIENILHTYLNSHQPIFDDECSEYFEMYDKIRQSKIYDYFIKGSPETSLYPKLQRGVNSVIATEAVSSLLTPSIYSKFNRLTLKGILKIADDLTNTKEPAYQEWAKRIYYTFLFNHTPKDFTQYDINMMEYNIGLDSDQIQDLVQQRKQAREKIVESDRAFNDEIKKHAVKNQFVTLGFEDYIKDFIESELMKNSDSESIVNMMKTVGLTRLPQTEMELIQALSYLDSLPQEEHVDNANLRFIARNNAWRAGGDGGIGDEIARDIEIRARAPQQNVSQIMLVLWAQYFKSGHKCHPLNLLKYFEHRTNENTINVIREIFADAITVQEFKSFGLIDKFKIYEFMDTRKLFSEKHANKNLFIKIIVNEVLNNKNKEFAARNIIEKILTRHGVTEYGKLEYGSDFEFADEREKMIEYYAQYWAENLGRDNGSDEYLKQVKNLVDFITSVSKDNQKRLFSSMIAEQLLNSISNKVIAQERAAKIFGDGAKFRVNGEKVNDLDYYGRGAEAVFNMLAKTPNRALATIKFLNKKLTDESIKQLIDECDDDKRREGFSEIINKQTLTIIHENFWGAPLVVRAVVMKRLLNSYSTNDDKKLALVTNTYFKPDSKYYKDAVLVLDCLYKKLPDYERNLILSALLSAGQNENNSQISNGEQVGRGLKMFFQTKGGAFVKFGQLLSYLPTLDSDIRKELATLRERANIPTRDEIFEIMKNSLPESEMKKISYVGKVLGGGSIYITIQIKYENKDCVIALMRPNTRDLINSGLGVISGTIDEMAARDKKFEPLKNIVAQAKQSCASEIDIEQDHKKYEKAVKTYEALKVHTKSGDYSPDVARWITYGCDEQQNNAYKIMEMAPGKSLTSDEFDEEEKHDMAKAYVALELALLLSGVAWDTDRHQGQQNFYNKSFRDFCIGIFDTGAQMDKDPKKIDKIMLGHLFYELIRGARSGKNISDILNSRVQRMDSVGKFLNLETSYIDGVQRGIIALSDIIEYQKEIKDENGKVIQESKSLTEQDLQDIIVAVMDSGTIDQDVMKTIRVKGILNKLRVLRPGWFKTLGEGIVKTPSKITVEWTGKIPALTQIKKLAKAKEEIEARIRELKSKQHLGIDKDLVKNGDTDESDLSMFGGLARA